MHSEVDKAVTVAVWVNEYVTKMKNASSNSMRIIGTNFLTVKEERN